MVSDEREAERARRSVLNSLNAAPRTRQQLTELLLRKNISEAVITEVLDRFEEVGLINDTQYAEIYLHSRIRNRHSSARTVAMELSRKGIARETIDDAIEQLPEGTDEETAFAYATSQVHRHRNEEPRVAARKIAAKLARRGFPPSICFRVAAQVVADVGEVPEEST